MDDQREYIVATEYWHKIEGGRVQCDLCPRFCKLHNGQQGLCVVRSCENDQIVMTSYGRSSGFCVDPIEKKPLNHFYPGTPILSFGTAGCNLACKFCQNWDISKARELRRLADQASPETIANAAHSHGCTSVAYTYNDPVIFMEYAIDVAQACAEKNIKSVAVTAGYITEQPRQVFFEHMDAVNVDLKAFSERFYKKICGGQLQPVLDTIRYIKEETDTWLELTTLLIPGENDSDQEIEDMADWILGNLGPDVPWHFTAFHPDWKMMDYPSTSPERVKQARQIAMAKGIHYVYTGNILDTTGQSTYCSGCGQLLIDRSGYEIRSWNLNEHGACSSCQKTVPGHFLTVPGQWGARRQPVHLANYSVPAM